MTSRQRIALSTEIVVQVELCDVSLTHAQAKLIAQETIRNPCLGWYASSWTVIH